MNLNKSFYYYGEGSHNRWFHQETDTLLESKDVWPEHDLLFTTMEKIKKGNRLIKFYMKDRYGGSVWVKHPDSSVYTARLEGNHELVTLQSWRIELTRGHRYGHDGRVESINPARIAGMVKKLRPLTLHESIMNSAAQACRGVHEAMPNIPSLIEVASMEVRGFNRQDCAATMDVLRTLHEHLCESGVVRPTLSAGITVNLEALVSRLTDPIKSYIKQVAESEETHKLTQDKHAVFFVQDPKTNITYALPDKSDGENLHYFKNSRGANNVLVGYEYKNANDLPEDALNNAATLQTMVSEHTRAVTGVGYAAPAKDSVVGLQAFVLLLKEDTVRQIEANADSSFTWSA